MQWKPLAIVSTTATLLLIVVLLLLLPACCGTRAPFTAAEQPPPLRVPPMGAESMPTPTEARARASTDGQMENVWFHFDDQLYLDIHWLRGQLIANTTGDPLNFDNKTSFVMKVDTATIGLDSRALDRLMNVYVFNYPNPPLRNLHIRTEGKQLRQEGIMHKVIDIPFILWADVSADHGRIRLHPTKIDICGLNGLGLLKAVGMTMEKMLTLPKEKGIAAEGNDLLLDPNRLLPPPKVELALVDAHVEGQQLIQQFDAGMHLPRMQPRHAEEKNYMLYRGGTLRMGKLLMVDADMHVVDTDPSDPFDFDIDRYNDQLVQGFTRNQADYSLLVYMRDFSDVGLPPRPGEKLAP
ncbi:MAG TPA: hypothetical protein VGR02_22460 [Thermoanaerobaculia bacterium]|nr:hypothetical protein [Thermoanaerobaculia bacterium]